MYCSIYIQKIPPVIVARQRTYHQHTTSSLAHRYRPDRLTETRTITGYTRARKIPSVCSSGAQSFSVFPRQAAATVRDADATCQEATRIPFARDPSRGIVFPRWIPPFYPPPPPVECMAPVAATLLLSPRATYADATPPPPPPPRDRRGIAAKTSKNHARHAQRTKQLLHTCATCRGPGTGAGRPFRFGVALDRTDPICSALARTGGRGGPQSPPLPLASLSTATGISLSLSPSPPDAMPRRNVAPTSSTTTVNVYSKQSYSYPEKQTNQSRKRTGYTVAKPGTKITEV